MNRVIRISHSPRPLESVVAAYRKCYRSEEKTDSEDYHLGEKDEKLLKQAISNGHESPLEHVSVTFDLNVSRACQTQLIRHRLASYSIESQRYVKPTGFFTPTFKNQKSHDIYAKFLKIAKDTYETLIELEEKKEDARYVLPMSTLGEIRMTMNLRELRHFIAERTCRHAQQEIRDVALRVKELTANIHPIFVFRCEKFWHCIAADQCRHCLGVSHES
jgi:thymidylate synthase (FAD)